MLIRLGNPLAGGVDSSTQEMGTLGVVNNVWILIGDNFKYPGFTRWRRSQLTSLFQDFSTSVNKFTLCTSRGADQWLTIEVGQSQHGTVVFTICGHRVIHPVRRPWYSTVIPVECLLRRDHNQLTGDGVVCVSTRLQDLWVFRPEIIKHHASVILDGDPVRITVAKCDQLFLRQALQLAEINVLSHRFTTKRARMESSFSSGTP